MYLNLGIKDWTQFQPFYFANKLYKYKKHKIKNRFSEEKLYIML